MATSGPVIKTLGRSDKFENDLKKLPQDVRDAAKDAIRDLLKQPIPTARRFHQLHGYKNPKLYTIDVFTNKSYKISFELKGTEAYLRRIATHKVIDRAP